MTATRPVKGSSQSPVLAARSAALDHLCAFLTSHSNLRSLVIVHARAQTLLMLPQDSARSNAKLKHVELHESPKSRSGLWLP